MGNWNPAETFRIRLRPRFRVKINWTFSRKDARKKFDYHKNYFKRSEDEEILRRARKESMNCGRYRLFWTSLNTTRGPNVDMTRLLERRRLVKSKNKEGRWELKFSSLASHRCWLQWS